MPVRILVVEDEDLIRWSLCQKFKQLGFKVSEAVDGATAAEHLKATSFDLIMLDHRLPDTTGLEILRDLRPRDPDVIVILMTAFSNVEDAVEAIKLGAYDYIPKPFQMDLVAATVQRALETTRLRRELRALRAQLHHQYAFDRVIGQHASMLRVMDTVRQVAASDATTVFLRGDTGTGKDLLAGVIHYNSDRAPKPFMNITCTALSEHLLESELFGHERGAFTDARNQKIGLLEAADGGTVFLDEVGDMAPRLQAKLLRFLEERAFRRVGGEREITVNVRIIAATNRDIEKAVEDGSFRRDLLFRLNVVPIEIPLLRDRGDDVKLLAEHMVNRFALEFKSPIDGIAVAAMQKLKRHTWPGNVRELRNVCERAVLLCQGSSVEPDDILVGSSVSPERFIKELELPNEGLDFVELERQILEQALTMADGNQTKAAELLNLSRDTLRYRSEKYGINLTGE